ncbi:MAG TPA: hypothetical protein VHK24_07300 [Steroidobacter sp.]|nr:hypothetical protein [Steroidobacter sp.]
MRTVISACLAGACLILGAQSAGTTDAELAERIIACAGERDDARRLGCFDRESRRLLEAREPPRPAATSASDEAFGGEDFGIAGSEAARSRAAKPTENKQKGPQRMTAKVTSLSRRPRGELVLTLDNGQVWAQKSAGAHLPVKVGESITIIAGALGSFHMIAGSRSMQVTRLR